MNGDGDSQWSIKCDGNTGTYEYGHEKGYNNDLIASITLERILKYF